MCQTKTTRKETTENFQAKMVYNNVEREKQGSIKSYNHREPSS